jgi:hypothetical protein
MLLFPALAMHRADKMFSSGAIMQADDPGARASTQSSTHAGRPRLHTVPRSGVRCVVRSSNARRGGHKKAWRFLCLAPSEESSSCRKSAQTIIRMSRIHDR